MPSSTFLRDRSFSNASWIGALYTSVGVDTRDKEKMAEANAFIRDSALTLISLSEECALRALLCTLQTSFSNLPATGETFESEFVADDIRGTGTVEIIATHLAVLLPSSNSAEFSYREGGRGDDYALFALSTFHAWDCSYTLPTNIRETNHRSTSSLRQVT